MKYHGKEMTTIHPSGCVAMTWEDAERMEKRNEACGWGFTFANCLHFVADHMEANECLERNAMRDKHIVAKLKQEMIEWRLEDANFHDLCGFLHECEYAVAIDWAIKDYGMEVK